jgi:hypothetical protein
VRLALNDCKKTDSQIRKLQSKDFSLYSEVCFSVKATNPQNRRITGQELNKTQQNSEKSNEEKAFSDACSVSFFRSFGTGAGFCKG